MAKKIVIKYGGVALKESDLGEIQQLRKEKFQPIIIHGGGKEISELSQQLGLQAHFKNGLRITDKATMDVVQMVLLGRVNARLVSALQQQGIKAIGLMGLAKAVQLSADLGQVGEIASFDSLALDVLCQKGYLPVLAPIAIGAEGKTFNVNGDSFAAAVAVALKAEKLFLMTDIDGVYLDPKQKGSKFLHLCADVARALVVRDGMIPKLKAAASAVERGVSSVLIGNALPTSTVVTL